MQAFFSHLYLRIWLAILCTIVIISTLMGLLWRMSKESEEAHDAQRALVVRNAEGEQLFTAPLLPMGNASGLGMIFEVELDGPVIWEDTIYMQLPPRPAPFGWMRDAGLELSSLFFWAIIVFAAFLALGTYPLVRRLTKRLEALQRDVARWGQGNLSQRMQAEGKDEIAFLAKQFNQAAQSIETLVHSHKMFLANASHELRSPLTRLRMGIELAGSPSLDDVSQSWKMSLQREVQELDQLIDEILLMSRLDNPESYWEKAQSFDLTGVVAEECSRAGADLQVQEAHLAEGDVRLWRRMVRNLLENARRYGGDTVEVWLGHDPQDAGKLLLRVSDRGPGVLPQERETIFHPFFRSKGASEKQGGVGLGLALVRSIAQHHQAQVICIDRPDGLQGACFEVRFPCT